MYWFLGFSNSITLDYCTTLSNFSLVSVYLNVFSRENKDLIFEKKLQHYKSEIRQRLTLKLKSANTYRAHHLITLHV